MTDAAWISGAAVVLPGTAIGGGSYVSDWSIVGHPSQESVQAALSHMSSSPGGGSLPSLVGPDFHAGTRIGANARIRSYSVIYEQVIAGDGLDVAHFVTIRERCRLGDEVYLKVGADLRREVRIGDGSTIAGLVGDRTVVGVGATILGDLVHRSRGAHRGEIEFGPIVEDDVFVGRHATVVGRVTLGRGAFIAAGVTVRRDVPPGAMVKGGTE